MRLSVYLTGAGFPRPIGAMCTGSAIVGPLAPTAQTCDGWLMAPALAGAKPRVRTHPEGIQPPFAMKKNTTRCCVQSSRNLESPLEANKCHGGISLVCF